MKTITQSFFAILLLCILPTASLNAQNTSPFVTADGNQVYCTGTPMHIATAFNITDPDDTTTDNIYIQISAGYVNGQDVLSLLPGHPTISATWNAAAGKLTLHGVGGSASYADFISAVLDVIYTNNNTGASGTRSFSITVGAANYLPSTGHYYMFVPQLYITWTNAQAAAAASTYYGLQGYLATITSAEEAQLCGLQASGNGWIGGSDAAVEGVWRWMTGPEAGTIFWNGGPAGSSPTYAFWNTGEPNNQNNEDYAHITAPGIGIPGSWNDLSVTGDASGAYASQGYVVEYGGMPGDPPITISASTTITFAKITSSTPGTRCGSGTVNLSAVASNGATVHWYSSATGGTELATGPTFTTPVINSTTTYYATPYGANCTTAARTPVTATVSALPTITTPNPAVSVCQGSTAVVQATPSAGTVHWYTTATGGTSIGTGTSFTTPSITATTSYYAEAVSSSTGCASASRVEVVVTPSPQPTVTVTPPAALCGQGSATIQATPSAGVVNWYAAATGGTILATGTTYTTPVITTTTTYYAEAANGTCISASRQPATVTVNALPTINPTTPAAVCAGQTATISVSTPSPATINWYGAATGGTLLGTGNSFTTPALNATTTYYAEAVDPQGCISATRTSTQVTVTPTPIVTVTTPVTTCNGSTATLQATPSAGATINWYTTATGGTAVGTGNSFTTPAITASTTYYAEAVNGTCTSSARSAVTVNVSASPTITVTTPAPLCGQGSATIQATPSSGGVVSWYTTATGGTALATGTTYTTPVITTTTTYYAEAANGSCISARQPVTVTVNALPTINSASPAAICAGQTATISVGSPTPATINWYGAATGGTILGTGNSFTTPVLNTTTTYYAEAVNAQGCTSAVRTAILVTVTPLPTLTVTTPVTTCAGSTATLQAVPSAGATIKWYTTATGGTAVATGNNFTTPALTAGTTYYAEATNGTCISAARSAVTITIGASPTVTVTTPPTLCGPGTATLQATPSAGTVNWYTTATGGTLIGTGNSITSPVVAATTTFYAEAVSGCSSLTRQPVTVTVNGLPTITSTSNGVICATGSTTIGAVPSSGTVNWYADATGGTILATGHSFATPVLTATTTYYAEVVTPGGCISAARTPVEATVVPLPTLTVTATVDVCGQVRATLEGIPSDGTINWYDAPTGGHLVGTGNTIQSPVITADRTFYAEANNGCLSATREAVTVFYHFLPAIGPDEDVVFCESGDVDLDAGVTGVTYLWSTAEISKTITINTAGLYTVIVTTPDGCIATKTFTASMLTAPDISTVIVKSSDALVVMAGNDPENYEYSLDNGPYQNSPNFYNLQNGYHSVSVVSTNGCGEDDYTFLVFVIPKFFTPNGDSINEEFTLGGMNQFPEITVDIFDRYGKLITVLNRRNRGWDGTFNGHRLPATDYWYVVRLNDITPEIKGHFSLLR